MSVHVDRAAPSELLDATEVAALDAQHVRRLLQAKDSVIDQHKQQIQTLERQIEWFRRQLFGTKSERFVPTPDPPADAPGPGARTGLARAAERRCKRT